MKKKLLNMMLCGIFVTTMLLSGCSSKKAEAYSEPKTSVEYEIHLLLDSDKVLDEEHLIKDEYLESFNSKKKYKLYGVVYLDTPERDFYREGWINRIRLREDKEGKDFKLTYKKRYPISEGDIDAAASKAMSDGFKEDSDFSWQVEWGFSSMTLSVSCDEDTEAAEYGGMGELSDESAIDMLGEAMPDMEKDWKKDGSGTTTLDSTKRIGPVYFKRYEGEYMGQEVDIEVWEMNNKTTGETDYITEMSFKTDDFETAKNIREMMIEELKKQGVLLEKDALKTQQIMEMDS